MIKISTIGYKGQVKRSEADEYIEIVNDGTGSVDVSGWVVNAGSARQDFEFPAGTVLAPGARIRIYTDQVHAETGGFSFGIHRAIWNNAGDTGTLRDAQGDEVDSYTYPQVKPDPWVFSTLSPGGEGIHDFGVQAVDAGPTLATFTLENRGSEPLVLADAPPVAVSGGPGFAVISQPSSPVPARAQVQFQVAFDPSAAGPQSGQLSIAVDGLDGPVLVPIAGQGLAEAQLRLTLDGHAVVDGGVYDIGQANPGGPLAASLRIENLGGGELVYDLSASGAAAFSVAAQSGATVAAGVALDTPITFRSNSVGPFETTLTIVSNDPRVGKLSIRLRAKVCAPAPRLNLRWANEWGEAGVEVVEGATYDIGDVPAGQPGSSMLIVRNAGAAPLDYTVLLGNTGGAFLINEANTYLEDQLPANHTGAVYPSIGFHPPPGAHPRGRRSVQVTVTSNDPSFAHVTFSVTLNCT